MRKETFSACLLGCALMLATGVGCGGDGTTAVGGAGEIYRAAHAGDDAGIRAAVAAGTPVDQTGRAGRTGLFIAVYNKNVRTAETLLELGANPGVPDKNGKTALMYAASRRYNDLLKQMIDKRPNLDQQDNGGYTAAHHAANMGNKVGYDMLKAAGADVTLMDAKGRTAADLIAIKQTPTDLGDM